MAHTRRTPDQPVASVTSAAPSASVDRDRRLRVYLWQMGIRILAFPVGAWLVYKGTWVWFGVALLLFAAFIPYIAVVLANARQAPPAGQGGQFVAGREELLAPTAGGDEDEPVVLVGELAEDDRAG
ncbi:Protein of unknown function [Kytococcus aerolatus]|uniref:DUF3099 domain-containing protein n=1 Tax=Kytococcus aerolatus TaxID=592308 RepID=A0A212T0X4_9MICO|nr:DUF3099 domain-containing protein [Kytococcus aerolatus]SNC59665.1 Protein of unknown function [Kytococcus aerolatus]